ncbi:hypothetical protein D9M68_832220 [compost metagenome]
MHALSVVSHTRALRSWWRSAVSHAKCRSTSPRARPGSSTYSRLITPQNRLALTIAIQVFCASSVRVYVCTFLKPTTNVVAVPSKVTTGSGTVSHFNPST